MVVFVIGGVLIAVVIIPAVRIMINHMLFAIYVVRSDTVKKCYFCFDLSYQEAPPLPTKHGLVVMRNSSNNTWDSAWHTDTRATHHFTNDANILNLQKFDYAGADSVQVGNDQGLQISKTRTSKISTPSSTFVLNNVLLVPKIHKNLLSVHQFCVDNNVYFEFHSYYFLVKD